MSYQREFKRQLNIAIVGAGSHSYRNILPAMTFLPVRVKAICDLNPEVAEKTAAQYGAKAYSSTSELYAGEKLDAVFICVSPKLHPTLACEAFDAGLHVWVEKPAAMRVAGVEKMIQHQKDRVCVVGYKKAFMPSTEKAVELFKTPIISERGKPAKTGEKMDAEAAFWEERGEGSAATLGKFANDWGFKSGVYAPIRTILAVYPMNIPPNGEQILSEGLPNDWLANGCHPLSFLIEVGGPVKAVTTHISKNSGGVCVLEYASGAIGTFHLASGSPLSQPQESYSVFGTNASLTIDNCNRVTLQRGIPFQYSKTTNFVPPGTDSGAIVWEAQNTLGTLENMALFTQGMYGEMRYFCDCILEGKAAVRGSLEFALHLTKVYEAGLLSNGKRVEIV